MQDKTYRPLGSRKQRQADVRVVAATNASIESLVAKGQMRADLFYRPPCVGRRWTDLVRSYRISWPTGLRRLLPLRD